MAFSEHLSDRTHWPHCFLLVLWFCTIRLAGQVPTVLDLEIKKICNNISWNILGLLFVWR
uniref:Coatomer subunit beta'-2 isoform X1 n=1 Tax=Rhizophora mucronata TaxID=61149 RepID=A0A2P2MLX8_RHIMU